MDFILEDILTDCLIDQFQVQFYLKNHQPRVNQPFDLTWRGLWTKHDR